MSKSSLAAAAAAILVSVAASPLAAPPAHAGGASMPSDASILSFEEAAAFSKQIERTLAADGVRVAIVHRTGWPRERLPEGVAYTHGAFWVYRDIVAENGETLRGYAVYNLYQGDGDSRPRTQSYLAQDWPIDFIRNTAVNDVAVIVPSPEMQRRLLEIIDGPRYAGLHNANYSMVADPLAGVYQNCNGFMLNVIAAAAWETDDQDQITANLRAYFEPQTLDVGVLARVFGPMTDPGLRTDDQRGRIKTATRRTMADFMERYGLLRSAFVIERDAMS